MVCHVLMLFALLWRTVEPGFSAYRTASCAQHGRGIIFYKLKKYIVMICNEMIV